MRILLSLFLLFSLSLSAQIDDAETLPDSVYSGTQGKFHVQGVAVDQTNGFIYFSFTDRLVKTDLEGNQVGSVTGIVGHLGDLVYEPENDKIYASLEFKQDAIGKGITQTLGVEPNYQVGFYIAIFDGSRIDKADMSADDEEVLQTIYLKEVVDDYLAVVKDGDKELQHRFACSGIDGITIAPAIGKPNSKKKYLYVAYGVYGDIERNDNDYQVILKYDPAKWHKLGKTLTQNKLHQSVPAKPKKKYFVKTGNSTYGIQNLAYDAHTGHLFAAVYKGKKPQFPNYSLFVIDAHKKPKKQLIISDNRTLKVETLSLLDAGLKDEQTRIRGWHFPWGTTGMCPLGDGLFYFSHNSRDSNGLESTTLYKYRWTGDAAAPFLIINQN